MVIFVPKEWQPKEGEVICTCNLKGRIRQVTCHREGCGRKWIRSLTVGEQTYRCLAHKQTLMDYSDSVYELCDHCKETGYVLEYNEKLSKEWRPHYDVRRRTRCTIL